MYIRIIYILISCGCRKKLVLTGVDQHIDLYICYRVIFRFCYIKSFFLNTTHFMQVWLKWVLPSSVNLVFKNNYGIEYWH